MTMEEVIKILDLYKNIQSIITDYRKYKNKKDDTILKLLNINEKKISEYQFLTTGDILILFTSSIVMKLYPDKKNDEIIKFAIHESAKYMKKKTKKDKIAYSNLTKAKLTFQDIKNQLYKKNKKSK